MTGRANPCTEEDEEEKTLVVPRPLGRDLAGSEEFHLPRKAAVLPQNTQDT